MRTQSRRRCALCLALALYATQGADTTEVAVTTLSFAPRILHIQALVSSSERLVLLNSAHGTVGVLNDDALIVGIKDRIARHVHTPLENMGPVVVASRSEATRVPRLASRTALCPAVWPP